MLFSIFQCTIDKSFGGTFWNTECVRIDFEISFNFVFVVFFH